MLLGLNSAQSRFTVNTSVTRATHFSMTSTNPFFELQRVKLTMDFITGDAVGFKSCVKQTLKSLRLGCIVKKQLVHDTLVTNVAIEGTFKEMHLMKAILFKKLEERYPFIQIPIPTTEPSYDSFNSYKIHASTPTNLTMVSSGCVSTNEDIVPLDSASNTGTATKSELLSWIGHLGHMFKKMTKTIVSIQ